MKTKISTHVVAVLVIISLITLSAFANPSYEAVSGGDFEEFSTGGVSPLGQPGNQWLITSVSSDQPFGVAMYDIDGSGALPVSKAFWVKPGGTGGGSFYLEQYVSLAEGLEYQFSADIFSITEAGNADGGSLSVSIFRLSSPSDLLDTYDFDIILSGTPEYAKLLGTFIPPAGTDYLLSIEISRDYQVSSKSPMVYLDNISLTCEPAIIPSPGALTLGSIGMIIVGWLRRKRYA